KRMVCMSLFQGVNVLILVLAVFAIAYYRGLGDMEARAMTFTTLIIANLCLILTNRSWSRTILATMKNSNIALWWVLGGAFLFLGLALYVPVLRGLFRFAFLHPVDLAICLLVGSTSILWFEALKFLNGRKK
ncbi:MAG TPA: cation-translocating P-type ATPase C-terminal domain-containing protein, partial [Candidatus Kapabacteria bacterium]|nr:cation-translocating P-type ATPase C-terminal domain-containing protein [Candidatus Kapabacteria bacterium]